MARVSPENRASHWDERYAQRGADRVSWFQPSPNESLQLIDALGLPRDAAIVDVGGGASTLVDHLIEAGRTDLTVLDFSASALKAARARVGNSRTVTWLHQDLLTWRPRKHYALWHDRAVFHFLVEAAEREAYLETLDHALAPGGAVVICTFALDGPRRCSGLPVERYAPHGLALALGPTFEVFETLREEHATPRGVVQPFTWVAARRIRP
jgi:SAM-dependent methyltransferase